MDNPEKYSEILISIEFYFTDGSEFEYTNKAKRFQDIFGVNPSGDIISDNVLDSKSKLVRYNGIKEGEVVYFSMDKIGKNFIRINKPVVVCSFRKISGSYPRYFFWYKYNCFFENTENKYLLTEICNFDVGKHNKIPKENLDYMIEKISAFPTCINRIIMNYFYK